MTRPSCPSSGRVRITVASHLRRVDLAVPSGVPFAELLPELARCVGVLERDTTYRGYRAVTRDGRVLQADAGLSAQGVQHGEIIAISACADDEARCLQDDAIEAVARAAHGAKPWEQGSARRARLGAAAALLLVGVPALVTAHGSSGTALFSAALAGVLVMTSILFSRAGGGTLRAVAVANVGCVYGGVAGLSVGWQASLTGPTVIQAAGGGLMATGMMAALAMTKGRIHMLPAVVVGVVVLSAGTLTRATDLDAAPFLTGLLVLVVITSGAFPGVALRATGAGRHALYPSSRGLAGVSPGLDMARVSADVRLAREILVGVSTTAGVLIVLLAPVAVSLGPAGSAVPILGSVVVMMRTRHYRAAVDVLVGTASGVLGIVSTGVSLLCLEATWRLATGIVVATAGLVVLATARRPHVGVVRPGRLDGLIEGAALGLLLPALLLAVGLSFGKS